MSFLDDFIENFFILERNIGECIFEGLFVVDYDIVLDIVVVNRYLVLELIVCNEVEFLNLDEGGWEEFVEEKFIILESNIG